MEPETVMELDRAAAARRGRWVGGCEPCVHIWDGNE
jgi:hypothetical protein